MRNWNNYKKFEDHVHDVEFLLYLWGIETSPLEVLISSDSGFYFTYEELKPRYGEYVDYKYDEFLLYLWGIETDLPPTHQDPYQSVFTLPMRNWNM